jgi:pimeloyl-ACP methyl ester carboxylesterase
MQILYENNRYRIAYEKGDSNKLIIAFTGVELKLGTSQKEEFQKTLSASSEKNHVCYVIDKQRSWYNFIEDEIADKLNQLITKISASKVITLGNSMGGYGAIIFAKRLKNCSSVIAFCPQYSVDPKITPFETRWAQYRDKLTEFSTQDVSSEISDKVTYNIFFGNKEKRDKKHRKLFVNLNLKNLNINVIDGASHSLAEYLKQQGRLLETVLSLV